MALVLAERVLESSLSYGTSDIALLGPQAGYQSFYKGIGLNNTCYYEIVNRANLQWEIGLGTVTSTSSLSRDTIISSSTGSRVNFTQGTKDVFVTLPASKSAYTDANGSLSITDQTSISVETSNLPNIRPSLNLDFAKSKSLDPRITFSRADGVNITGTAAYYDGKTTVLAEQNLIFNSQTFNISPWIYTGCIVIPNATIAPDGTTTGTKIVLNSAVFPNHGVFQNIQAMGSTTYTISVYAKAAEYNFLSMHDNYWGQYSVVFNISTGTLVSGAGGQTPESVGNGWYRCSVVFTRNNNVGLTPVFCGLATGTSNASDIGDNVSGIYIWGAQAEQRSSNTSYTQTSNLNLLSYSQTFTDSSWTKTGSSISSTLFTDPLGTNTANKIIESSAISIHGVSFPTGTMISGNNFIFSTYLKAGERANAAIFLFDGISYNQTWINLSSGTQITTDNSSNVNISSIGSGWYRCAMNCTIPIDSYYSSRVTTGGIVALNSGTYTAPTEMVVNGDFSSSTGWSLGTGWSIINGQAVSTGSAININRADCTFVAGKRYLCQFDIIATNGIGLVFELPTVQISVNKTTVGRFSRIVTSTFTGTTPFYIYGQGNFVGIINNVSIKEIPGQYTGDGTSGIYVWGAQLERAYNTITGSANSGLNILTYSNTFDVWAKANSNIQYNLLNYSQDFSNAAWNKEATFTISPAAVNDPLGTQTANLASTVSLSRGMYQMQAGFLNTIYTNSIYIKANTSNSAYFGLSNETESVSNYYLFDISNQSASQTTFGFSNSSYLITQTGSGWFRISVTAQSPATNLNQINTFFRLPLANTSIYAWGCQIVVGNTAGDYTATTSTSLPIKYLAPDNTYSAEKIYEDATSAQHIIYRNVSVIANVSYTWSCYIKAAEQTKTQFNRYDIGGFAVQIDLIAGTILGTYGFISSSITNAGNGWYKISCDLNIPTSQSISLGHQPYASTPYYLGNGSSGILIWNCQFTVKQAVSYYAPTFGASTTISNYIPQLMFAPQNTPRFDHDPITGRSLGLLIEPSANNSFIKSSAVYSWTSQSNITTIPNATICPDGTKNATLLIPNTVANQHYIYDAVGSFAANGVMCTFSVYVKPKGISEFGLGFAYNSNGTNFNLNTVTAVNYGSIISTDLTKCITHVGNGWYRVFMTGTPAANTPCFFQTKSMVSFIASDGVSGIYLWGAQLETGSFATSYIPTVATAVTRSMDQASITGTNFSSWYNQGQGTIYGEFNLLNASSISMIPYAIDNGTSNGYEIYKNLYASGLYAYAGTNNTTLLNNTTLPNTLYKTIISYGTSIYATVNGNTLGLISTGGLSGALPNQLAIGHGQQSNGIMAGYIKKISYYPVALSANTLIGLTK